MLPFVSLGEWKCRKVEAHGKRRVCCRYNVWVDKRMQTRSSAFQTNKCIVQYVGQERILMTVSCAMLLLNVVMSMAGTWNGISAKYLRHHWWRKESLSIGQAPGGTGQLLFVYNDKWVACYLLLCLSFPERTVPFLSLVGSPKQDNDERWIRWLSILTNNPNNGIKVEWSALSIGIQSVIHWKEDFNRGL